MKTGLPSARRLVRASITILADSAYARARVMWSGFGGKGRPAMCLIRSGSYRNTTIVYPIVKPMMSQALILLAIDRHWPSQKITISAKSGRTEGAVQLGKIGRAHV